jgi:hypothetical protein
MAYDPSKDKVLETWENEETGLIVSINQYGDGEPKLQIGPRGYTKRDGTTATTKAGRLLEEIKEKLNAYYLDEG